MRRQFITHPDYQLGFTLAFIRGVFVSILFPSLALFLTLYFASKNPALTNDQQAVLIEGCHRLATSFVWIALVAVGICGLLGFYLSYKFAGPVRRIEDWLVQRLSGANPATTQITLRPGDEMLSIARLMNRLFDR